VCFLRTRGFSQNGVVGGYGFLEIQTDPLPGWVEVARKNELWSHKGMVLHSKALCCRLASFDVERSIA